LRIAKSIARWSELRIDEQDLSRYMEIVCLRTLKEPPTYSSRSQKGGESNETWHSPPSILLLKESACERHESRISRERKNKVGFLEAKSLMTFE
jgi:hypothetical protein